MILDPLYRIHSWIATRQFERTPVHARVWERGALWVVRRTLDLCEVVQRWMVLKSQYPLDLDLREPPVVQTRKIKIHFTSCPKCWDKFQMAWPDKEGMHCCESCGYKWQIVKKEDNHG
jgi:hypothetical protein